MKLYLVEMEGRDALDRSALYVLAEDLNSAERIATPDSNFCGQRITCIRICADQTNHSLVMQDDPELQPDPKPEPAPELPPMAGPRNMLKWNANTLAWEEIETPRPSFE